MKRNRLIINEKFKTDQYKKITNELRRRGYIVKAAVNSKKEIVYLFFSPKKDEGYIYFVCFDEKEEWKKGDIAILNVGGMKIEWGFVGRFEMYVEVIPHILSGVVWEELNTLESINIILTSVKSNHKDYVHGGFHSLLFANFLNMTGLLLQMNYNGNLYYQEYFSDKLKEMARELKRMGYIVKIAIDKECGLAKYVFFSKPIDEACIYTIWFELQVDGFFVTGAMFNYSDNTPQTAEPIGLGAPSYYYTNGQHQNQKWQTDFEGCVNWLINHVARGRKQFKKNSKSDHYNIDDVFENEGFKMFLARNRLVLQTV